ncbi:MAG: alkaline phosphatase family protein [Thermoplasmata archaeon]|nr:alkaline phosphatase family protein [Thermoplasmata archaeon]
MDPRRRRLLVLGLDSVPPEFLFERYLPRMPRLKTVLDRSRFGTLLSTDPPITVPAWAVMFTGMDPGTLGLYGFRHRRPGSYLEMYTPTPQMLRSPPLWETLSRLGRRVAVIGMPPGYPPPTVNGIYVSDFLTPDGAKDFVTPASLVPEIEAIPGGYDFDITFRAEDRPRVERELFAMTRKRFALARTLWQKEPWDLFALHEIGPDRLHHAFWKFFDPAHPRYVASSEYADVADRYYAMLDEEIGAFLDHVPEDVTIFVASDHGSMAMHGCFAINQWLQQQGFLRLRTRSPEPGTPFEQLDVDWNHTTAWGAGGYYARIFFNLRGREPEGRLAPAEIPALILRLTRELGAVRRPDGAPLGVRVLEPAQTYRSVQSDPPDLMLYFGDLRWRSAGTVGHPGLFLTENDTGPDDAVHSFDGLFAFADPRRPGTEHLPPQRIIDVAPTLLKHLGIPVPDTMQGRPIAALE